MATSKLLAEPTTATWTWTCPNRQASARPPDEAAPAEPEVRTWPAAQTRWLEARVELPDRTPLGEQPWVLALDRQLERSAVHGADGPVVALERGEDPRAIAGLAAAAPTESGGIAKLGLPPDAERVWLVVSGDYVYSLEPTEVEVPSASAPVELRAVLGARVTGRLVAPPAFAGEEPLSVSDLPVELDWSLNAALELGTAEAEDLDRETRSDEGGRFGFRALPVGKPQTISTATSPVARVFHDDIQLSPGDHVEVELDLSVGGTVRGRVVDEAGNPVEGADVRALGREFFGRPTEGLRMGILRRVRSLRADRPDARPGLAAREQGRIPDSPRRRLRPRGPRGA